MPNWCLNNLTVEHSDPAMVDRFEAAYNRGETCNEFIPVPEDIGEGWYDFCVNNWGTKWDIGCENNRTHGLKPTRVGNQVTVTFDSAWAPPIGLYEELDRLGFMVDATYFEPGMAYCGIWHDGEDLYTEYTDKSMIPVRIWEDYNLEEFFEDEVEA
jgi:hypothetical protein